MWNVYDRVMSNLPRSNNSVEGWHNAFATRVAIAHPTIKKLAEKIRSEQSKFEIDIALNFFKVNSQNQKKPLIENWTKESPV